MKMAQQTVPRGSARGAGALKMRRLRGAGEDLEMVVNQPKFCNKAADL
jgi:hypothetical protein